MARWIHEFRSTGERALSEGERIALRRRAQALGAQHVLLAVTGAFTMPVGVVVGIAIAADPNPLGWLIAIASLVGGAYLLVWSGHAERLALLHRRALRLGTVEEFRRVPGDETSRRIWEGKQKEDEDEADERIRMPMGEYWRIDERFEENLAHTARGRVEAFDAVGRDGAVLWVEGRAVRRLMEPPVWEVLD